MKTISSQNGWNEKKARRARKKDSGRWAFNLATESLFALGSSEAVFRVAYRTADGRLRLLPR
jgi:hypothetical protein